LEALVLAILAYGPSFRRHFRRSLTDDQMGLRDRELSPLSSNDIGDKMHLKSSEFSNHLNKSMKRSVTDTIRDHMDGEMELQMSIQKPAYIPGEFAFAFVVQANQLTKFNIWFS